MHLHREAPDAGAPYRAEVARQLRELVRRERERARSERRAFFQPDVTSPEAYARSAESYREAFRQMLGWPLTEARDAAVPRVREHFVAEDDLGRVYRLWVRSLPDLETYGLLFLPASGGPWPLVISQHGGGGTPELCSDFFGSANYNDMTRRVLRRGAAVFAPQLPLWRPEFGPGVDRLQLDGQLKQLGGSVAALDVHQLRQCLRALTARDDIDAGRVGMVGLSWGGFYTLVTAALEPSIRVALASCFFNDRERYDLQPSVWFAAARRFLDAEIAGLVCPRPLYVEVGRGDQMFDAASARPEAERARGWYERLGLAERFVYCEHPGGHELSRTDEGIEFLFRWL